MAASAAASNKEEVSHRCIKNPFASFPHVRLRASTICRSSLEQHFSSQKQMEIEG